MQSTAYEAILYIASVNDANRVRVANEINTTFYNLLLTRRFALCKVSVTCWGYNYGLPYRCRQVWNVTAFLHRAALTSFFLWAQFLLPLLLFGRPSLFSFCTWSNHFRRQSWDMFVKTKWRTTCVVHFWYPLVASYAVYYNLPSQPHVFSVRFYSLRDTFFASVHECASFCSVINCNSVSF